MEISIDPEPAPDEREAIEAALARLTEEDVPSAYRSAWRRAGIAENVDAD